MIHGEGQAFRGAAFEAVLAVSGPKRAKAYALCGRGDRVYLGGDSVRLQGRGCGCRACPRCSRLKGRRIVRRILQWFERAEHGQVVHLTCTQRVVRGESLTAARARCLKCWLGFKRRLSALGVSAGLCSHHVVWSENAGGWHYHVHCLLESVSAVPLGDFERAWSSAGGADGVTDRRAHCRLVCGSGARVGELGGDAGDVDLWSEAAAPIARALQYPIRDAVQGLSSWRLGGPERMSGAVRELVESSRGWRLFECLGKWRKRPPAVDDPAPEAEKAEGGEACAPVAAEVMLGSPDRVLWLAFRGDLSARRALLTLERNCCNVSEFAKRLVWFCGLVRSSG